MARSTKNNNEEYIIQVNAQNLATYKKTIDPFVKKRYRQTKLINTGIGGFFASMKGVKVDEARAFLNKAFENEELLQSALQKIDTNKTCVEYLAKIAGELDTKAIRKKNSDDLPIIMKKHKYPGFKGSHNPWNDPKVTQKDFYDGAACSFMIYHLVESDGPARVTKQAKPISPSKKNRK